MRKVTVILFIVLSCFMLSSCGYNEGVVQKADKSYLKFSGSVRGAVVQIDQNAPFDLSVSEPGAPGGYLYQILPGKHQLLIQKEGVPVVQQVIFIATGETKEVVIP